MHFHGKRDFPGNWSAEEKAKVTFGFCSRKSVELSLPAMLPTESNIAKSKDSWTTFRRIGCSSAHRSRGLAQFGRRGFLPPADIFSLFTTACIYTGELMVHMMMFVKWTKNSNSWLQNIVSVTLLVLPKHNWRHGSLASPEFSWNIKCYSVPLHSIFIRFGYVLSS